MPKMPYKDPSNWSHFVAFLAFLWDCMPDWAKLLVLSIPLTIARAIRAHKRPWGDAILEALIGSVMVVCVALGVKHFGASEWITWAVIGAFVGLGFNPTIEIAKDILQRVIDMFLPKKD